jgi:hypothetical protein
MNNKPLFTRFSGKGEDKAEAFEMIRMATVASIGRTSTKNITDETMNRDAKKSF